MKNSDKSINSRLVIQTYIFSACDYNVKVATELWLKVKEVMRDIDVIRWEFRIDKVIEDEITKR